MSRAPHPMLAGLCRTGGASARLVAALERAEARLGALEIDLEAHPLCAPGGWEALTLEAAEADLLFHPCSLTGRLERRKIRRKFWVKQLENALGSLHVSEVMNTHI